MTSVSHMVLNQFQLCGYSVSYNDFVKLLFFFVITRSANSREKDNNVAPVSLLEHGADVNAWDNWRKTPLLGAVKNGRLKAARLLVEHRCRGQ